MRRHWIRCAYCRGQHPTMAELERCAAQRIAWEAAEYRRDRAEMDDLSDCATESPVIVDYPLLASESKEDATHA